MNRFIQGQAEKVIGVLSGWDRVRFRGTVRMLANVAGLWRFLRFSGRSLLKDFGKHAEELSKRTREASLGAAEKKGRPVVHLSNPGVCKEDVAREIQARDGVKEGLICVLTATEPCQSYNIRSRVQLEGGRRLELVSAYRKCQHLYHYFLHPEFGFMHVRLQTWLPFNAFVCINGREWLGRKMDAQGIGYVRRENCFTQVADVEKAQALLDEQVRFNWAEALGNLVLEVNPAFAGICGQCTMGYYWSAQESEWASDIMFKEQAELTALFGRLVRHGIEGLGSRDVLRFLGRRVRMDGEVRRNFAGEVTSDVKERAEGMRIKHRVGRNSVKMYNKQGTVLRTETTLNDMRDFRSPRMKEGKVVWERMRKGVSDIKRRAEVSQASNERYLEAMAAVEDKTPLKELTEALARGVVKEGRRARGLNVLGAEDARLLEVVGDGRHVVNGFRNREVREMLFGQSASKQERQRQSGQVTRKLSLLRLHGIIKKVGGTHRYVVTEKGRRIIAALQAARQADVATLARAA